METFSLSLGGYEIAVAEVRQLMMTAGGAGDGDGDEEDEDEDENTKDDANGTGR